MRALDPRIVQVKIQFHSCYCGLCLSEIPLPNNCIALGVVRNSEVIQASDNPTVHCGDEIIAAAFHRGFAPALRLTLEKIHHVSWSALRSPWPRETNPCFLKFSLNLDNKVLSP